MHANEREPQGTDISLQTYMHIQRQRKREEGRRKDPKTEIKTDKKSGQKRKGEDAEMEKGELKEGYGGERKRHREREGEKKKTGRKAVWCFNRKIRAVGARQACSHHNGSHLRMLLQAWLWLRLTLLGLQHRAALRLSTSAMTCLQSLLKNWVCLISQHSSIPRLRCCSAAHETAPLKRHV